ncbi:MAG: hypothetical protein QXP42_03390 [Candidatus Micrarchaeia archaeon]
MEDIRNLISNIEERLRRIEDLLESIGTQNGGDLLEGNLVSRLNDISERLESIEKRLSDIELRVSEMERS